MITIERLQAALIEQMGHGAVHTGDDSCGCGGEILRKHCDEIHDETDWAGDPCPLCNCEWCAEMAELCGVVRDPVS